MKLLATISLLVGLVTCLSAFANTHATASLENMSNSIQSLEKIKNAIKTACDNQKQLAPSDVHDSKSTKVEMSFPSGANLWANNEGFSLTTSSQNIRPCRVQEQLLIWATGDLKKVQAILQAKVSAAESELQATDRQLDAFNTAKTIFEKARKHVEIMMGAARDYESSIKKQFQVHAAIYECYGESAQSQGQVCNQATTPAVVNFPLSGSCAEYTGFSSGQCAVHTPAKLKANQDIHQKLYGEYNSKAKSELANIASQASQLRTKLIADEAALAKRYQQLANSGNGATTTPPGDGTQTGNQEIDDWANLSEGHQARATNLNNFQREAYQAAKEGRTEFTYKDFYGRTQRVQEVGGFVQQIFGQNPDPFTTSGLDAVPGSFEGIPDYSTPVPSAVLSSAGNPTGSGFPSVATAATDLASSASGIPSFEGIGQAAVTAGTVAPLVSAGMQMMGGQENTAGANGIAPVSPLNAISNQEVNGVASITGPNTVSLAGNNQDQTTSGSFFPKNLSALNNSGGEIPANLSDYVAQRGKARESGGIDLETQFTRNSIEAKKNEVANKKSLLKDVLAQMEAEKLQSNDKAGGVGGTLSSQANLLANMEAGSNPEDVSGASVMQEALASNNSGENLEHKKRAQKELANLEAILAQSDTELLKMLEAGNADVSELNNDEEMKKLISALEGGDSSAMEKINQRLRIKGMMNVTKAIQHTKGGATQYLKKSSVQATDLGFLYFKINLFKAHCNAFPKEVCGQDQNAKPIEIKKANDRFTSL